MFKSGFKMLPSTLFALTLLVSPIAHAGGDISGGGSVVQTPNGPVLLDLYLAGQRAQAQTGTQFNLPNTHAYRALEIDRLNGESSEISRQVQARLDVWASSSPVLVRFLRMALANAPIHYTSYKIRLADARYWAPSGANLPSTPTTVALYAKSFGVLISKSDFEALDSDSQVGLVIHELVRHLQLHYGFQISDESLQSLAATITLKSPSAGETLDQVAYIGQIASNRAEFQETMNQDLGEACDVVQSMPQVCAPQAQAFSQRYCSSGRAVDPSSVITLARSISSLSGCVPAASEEAQAYYSQAGTPYRKLVQLGVSMVKHSMQQRPISADPALYGVMDATLRLQTAGLSSAIDAAERRVAWINGARRSVRGMFSALVQDGYLAQ